MRKIVAGLIVAVAIPAAWSTSAEANCRGCWIGAGVAGAVIAGAAIANAPYYGYGYRPYGYAYGPYAYRYPRAVPYAPAYYGVHYGTPSPFYGARY